MNNSILPDIFLVAAGSASIAFLWGTVLRLTKEKLKLEDQNMAKFFIFLCSLPLLGITLYYGFDLLSSVLVFDNPI